MFLLRHRLSKIDGLFRAALKFLHVGVPARTTHPCIELLEARVAPAGTYYWRPANNSTAFGDRLNWRDAANNGQVAPAVPGQFDTVRFDNQSNRDCVIDGSRSVGALQMSGFTSALQIDPGRLLGVLGVDDGGVGLPSLLDGARITNGAANNQAGLEGRILFGADLVTIQGQTFLWRTNLWNDATIDLSQNGSLLKFQESGVFYNRARGVVNWSGDNIIGVADRVLNEGLFDISGAGALSGYARTKFDNRGGVLKEGNSTAWITVPFWNATSDSILRIDEGKLVLMQRDLQQAGLTVLNGGTLTGGVTLGGGTLAGWGSEYGDVLCQSPTNPAQAPQANLIHPGLPGEPGVLWISSRLIMSPQTTLVIDSDANGDVGQIGMPNGSTISINQASLRVNRDVAWTPEPGQMFFVIGAPTFAGGLGFPAANTTINANNWTSTLGVANCSFVVRGPGAAPETNSIFLLVQAPPMAFEGNRQNNLVLGQFIDPNAAGSYSIAIAWGDGTTSRATPSLPNADITLHQSPTDPTVWTVVGGHTYIGVGVFLATGTIYPGSYDFSGSAPPPIATCSTALFVADATVTGHVDNVSGTAGTPLSTSQPIGSFADANPSAAPADFDVALDWGDGTVSDSRDTNPQVWVTADSSTPGHFFVWGSHTYTNAVSFPLILSVYDDGGSSASASGTAVISGEISATAVAVQGTENTPLTSVAVATFTTGVAGATAPDFSAMIDWGDGHNSAGNITASNGVFTVTGSHTYVAADYTATVTIQRSGGGSATLTTPVSIADAALSAQPVNFSSYTTVPFSNVNIASFTDADPAASADIFTAWIDWGDGSTPDVGDVELGGGQTFQVYGDHAYAAAGTYSVTINLVDQAGASASVTAAAIIAQAQAPSLANIADYSVNEGDTLHVYPSAYDPQSLTLYFSLVNPPARASIDPATGEITYRADDGPVVPLTVEVISAAGLSDSKTFHVSITDLAPVADGFTASELIANIGDNVTFTLIDPHDPAGMDPASEFTYTWTVDNGTPVTNTSTSLTTSFSTTGQHQVHVRITDDDGMYTDYTLWINVMGSNA
jgi:hypothetical protein